MSELVVTPEDMREAGYKTGNLAPCPFCGRPYPMTCTRFNADTGIYRVEVHCSEWRCDARLGSNSRDLAEARSEATAKWNRRATTEPEETP